MKYTIDVQLDLNLLNDVIFNWTSNGIILQDPQRFLEHCNLTWTVVDLYLDMPHFYILCLEANCVIYTISLKINETWKLMHFTAMCQISEINNDQAVLKATFFNVCIFLAKI